MYGNQSRDRLNRPPGLSGGRFVSVASVSVGSRLLGDHVDIVRFDDAEHTGR